MKNNMQYLGDFATRSDQHFSQKDHTVHSDYTGKIEGDKFCIYKCGNIIMKNTLCTVLRGTYDNDIMLFGSMFFLYILFCSA